MNTDNDVGDTAAGSASEEFGILDSLPGKADGGHASPTLETEGVRAAADLPNEEEGLADGTPPDHSQVQASLNANADADDGLFADASAGRLATPPTDETDGLDSEEEGVVTESQGHHVGDRDEALVEDGPTGAVPEYREPVGGHKVTRSSAHRDAQDSDDRGRPGDRGALPIAGYKDLTVPQIMEKIEAMSRDEMRAVQRYEESHRRRKTLLVRLERRLRDPKPDAKENRSRPDGAAAPDRARHS